MLDWISIAVLHFLDPWCKRGVLLLFFFITRGRGGIDSLQMSIDAVY
jgi:hypothetical protein